MYSFSLGEIIEDELEARRWTKETLAGMLGYSSLEVTDLLEGNLELTLAVAGDLSQVFGTGTQFWLNLDELCREQKS